MAPKSARAVSAMPALGVEFSHSTLLPGGGVLTQVRTMPCAVLELKYIRTVSGSGTGFARASTTLGEPRSCQNSDAESVWKTNGAVSGRFMMPSRIHEMGAVVTA